MTLKVDWLRGCATALITPFTSEGAVDDRRLREFIEYQIGGGVKVLVPCGTTGESVTMSDAENELVIRTTIEVARGRAKVIAGAGSNATAVAIQKARAARSLGADGILCVAPYYNKPTQDGLYQHFRAIAEAVLRLARDVENIVAVKEASSNLSQIMEILRGRPENFRVISGDDALTLAMIALGAEGLISVASNEAPELMSRLNDEALAGNWDEARALHYKLLPLMEANFIESSPGPVKAALALMGLIEEKLRLPLVPVQDKTRARMREILNEIGLLKESSHAVA